ncbi:hypothetical protein, partial [Streptomyces sp. MBT62]|uniref:hypothetical protein n=1 Tax=Streptomyces sp. MBT62 TaxID=2800410 RepID=UPI00190B8FBC
TAADGPALPVPGGQGGSVRSRTGAAKLITSITRRCAVRTTTSVLMGNEQSLEQFDGVCGVPW